MFSLSPFIPGRILKHNSCYCVQIEELKPIYNRAYAGSGLFTELDAKTFAKDLKAADHNVFA